MNLAHEFHDKNEKALLGVLFTAALLAAPGASEAVTLFGSLSNFDTVNDTGETAYGFEIELDGVSGVGATFTANRYGAPSIIPFNGGVYVRYRAGWDSVVQQFVQANQGPALAGVGAGTVVDTHITPTAGHQCVYWLPNYATSGCDHFGVVLPYYSPPPTRVVYRWLVADPATPGGFLYAGTSVAPAAPTAAVPLPPAPPPALPVVLIPQPVFAVAPNNVVVAQIEAPKPPNPELQFGDAQWVKVYKTELPQEVRLDDLQSDNPAVVPEDPAQIETAWKLIQSNPHNPDSGSSVLRSQGQAGSGSRAVVRRYEFYKFTGSYDPVDHGAICADVFCNAPSDSELGAYIGAQMAAANIGNPSLTVIKSGSGSVTGYGGKINCGGTCTAAGNLGEVATLTETPPSNAVFTGWDGACVGTQTTCTVTLSDQMQVTAAFTQIYTLSIGGTGSNGAVTGTPAGVLGTAINCGAKGCASAKFMVGTAVTLTATPASGHSFVDWTGSGAGACNPSSVPTCTVTISQNTSVTANFH